MSWANEQCMSKNPQSDNRTAKFMVVAIIGPSTNVGLELFRGRHIAEIRSMFMTLSERVQDLEARLDRIAEEMRQVSETNSSAPQLDSLLDLFNQACWVARDLHFQVSGERLTDSPEIKSVVSVFHRYSHLAAKLELRRDLTQTQRANAKEHRIHGDFRIESVEKAIEERNDLKSLFRQYSMKRGTSEPRVSNVVLPALAL